MRVTSLFLLLAGGLTLGQLAGCSTAKDSASHGTTAATGAYPAAVGFNQAGSDARAVALADRAMREMGGYDAWSRTRYLAWSFFGGQYQVWDKQTGDFHWEKDSLVANYNLLAKTGRVFSRGRDISATPAGQQLLGKLNGIWINNSYWLLMPFKLKDSGVTLGYQGPGQLMTGTPAEVLRLTFANVGDTPQNRYEVLVSPTTGLVEEWAYFANAADAQPAFRRRWADYARHGQVLLAADRSSAAKPARLDNIAAPATLPPGTMSSPVAIARLTD